MAEPLEREEWHSGDLPEEEWFGVAVNMRAALDRAEKKKAELVERLEQAEAAMDAMKGALHSTQDTLLHKVPRTEAVRQQLEVNRKALAANPPEEPAG